MKINTIQVKPYTVRDLSILYGVSVPTIRSWLTLIEKEIGPKKGHFFMISQVTIIFEKLGLPGEIENE